MTGEIASPGTASTVLGFVGKVTAPVTKAIDGLNLAIGKATYAFVLMLPKFPAARLFVDLVFQFGHSHPHPPTFGVPIPSMGPILASGAQSVLINGLPAARCGDLGLSAWCGGYVPMFEVMTGSSHVFMGGARAARMLTDPTFHCLPDPFAGMGKVAKAQKLLSVGEKIGLGAAVVMSGLGKLASGEAGDAEVDALEQRAQAAADAAADAEASGTEAEMLAMVASLAANDAAQTAAAKAVEASVATAQMAADIAAAAMGMLMGKDPGVGFPFGFIMTGSPNVLVGGFPMPGWMTILRGLLKMLQPVLRRVQMKLPAGKLKKALCFLTGDPVDVASGRVVTSAIDFEFPGRIPIVFERSYDSASIDYEGPLGWGWTHSFDHHLWYDRRQRAMIWRDSEGRVVGFDPLGVGQRVYHPFEKVWLQRTGEAEYAIIGQESQLRYNFGAASVAQVGQSEETALRLLEIRDRNDNRVELEYTGGRLSAIDDGVGMRLLMSYEQMPDGRIRLREVRRALAREQSAMLVRYDYNAAGELEAVTDRTQVPFRYYYDRHLMVRRMTRNGLSFYFEYQGEGREARCIHTWGDGGIYERWITYQPRARATIVRDSLGGETVYHYNELDQVTRLRNAEGGISKYEYGSVGELLTEEDELGRKRTYGYNELYNRTQVTQKDGTTRRAEYDQASQLVLIEDEIGGKWRREYDGRANIVAEIDAEGGRREFQYNAKGDVTEVRGALGGVIRIEWDQAGQPTTLIRPSGLRTTYEHDGERRLVQVKDEATGLSSRFDHDRVGRLQRITEFDSRGRTASVEQYEYDPEGNLTLYIDGLGNRARYRFGGFNKIVERLDGLGYKCQLEYDSEERLVRIENQRNESHRIEYDLLDRVVREVGFDGGERVYEYDLAGQLMRQRDEARRETQYRRDTAGRVIKRLRGDLTSVEYEYDMCGRLVSARNPASELTVTYDAVWRVTKEEQNGSAVEFEYDAEGRRVARRVLRKGAEDDGRLVQYNYDAEGTLTGIRVAGQEIDYEFDQARRVRTRKLPNGLMDTYRYDESGRVDIENVTPKASGKEIVRRAYKWDAIGNVVEVQDSLRGTRRYRYDAAERLSQVERLLVREGPSAPGSTRLREDLPPERKLWSASGSEESRSKSRIEGETEEFEYDGAGNLVERRKRQGGKRSFSYGRGDRLEQLEGTQYFYDAAGNLSEKRNPEWGVIRYEYDADDQLIAIEDVGSGRIEFEYDALGRRIMKRAGKEEVGFIWDGDVLLEEQRIDRIGGGVNSSYEYVNLPASFAPALRVAREGGKGARIEAYHTDYLGTPREVTGEDGALVWQAEYDEYGRAEVNKEDTEQPIRFQGQYEDSETGLHYNVHRYYDPESGRYITKDPIGLLGGLNHYAYTSNPANWVDPLGLVWNPAKANAKYPGIGTTPNGGPTFSGTPYLFPTTGSQSSVVQIQLQGSRGRDFTQAFKEAGISPEAAKGYTWHHIDDFDPVTGRSTMQLVQTKVHQATSGHSGSAKQFSSHFGVDYDTAEAVEKAKKQGWCKG